MLGADPQPYSVTLKPTGNSALDSALHDAATLISLQDKPPVGGFALVQRARQDVDRFQSVLQSYGYYAANIDIADCRPPDHRSRRCPTSSISCRPNPRRR